MALHVNTFKGGLDLDTNVNAYDNTHYPYALNLRILSDGENSSGTLTSMEDSELICNIPIDYTVVGLSTIRDNLVMFTKNGSLGNIYYIPFSALNSSLNIATYLKVSKQFNFGTEVQIVARHETQNAQKIYWVDNVNLIRFVNLTLDSTTLNAMQLDEFNIVQEVTMSTPTLNSIVSGSLKVGSFQYAYCLYNLGGAETAYSSASGIIPISIASLTDSTSLLFRGSNIGETSNKGIKISISNIDTTFDRIRVVRLFYAEQNSSPEIDIIHEGSYSSSIIVVDSGNNSLGTISINDYRYIPNIFSAKTLESKNDYLFAGNITEIPLEVNFDARAYRFNNVGVNKLYNAGFGAIQWGVDTQGYDVPEEYDCANPYNDVSIDTTRSISNTYKFQSNGTVLGGTGKYISFRFIVNERPVDDAHTDAQYLRTYTKAGSNGYQDLSNPIFVHNYTGYQRDDIYRFAIVFYDKYGRQSFAKWIADIRFPSEIDGWWYSISGSTIRDLGIYFEINAAGKLLLESQGITSWEIVRAERTYDDATVKDCGYVSSLLNDGHKMRWKDFPEISSTDNNTPLALEYITPETNYNKNNYNPYNRLDIYSGDTLNGLVSKNNGSIGATCIVFKLSGTSTEQTPTTKTIDKAMLFNHYNTETYVSMQTVGYAKQLSNRFGPMYSRDNDNKDPRQYNRCTKGTTLVLKINNSAPSNGVKYVRRRSHSIPYGGYSYANINNTIYYPCSASIPINTTSVNVFGGDCYIAWFEYLRGVWSNETAIIISNGDRRVRNCSNQTAYLLVESKINIKYTINPTWSYYDDGNITNYGESTLADVGYEYNAMRETRGVYSLLWNNEDLFTQDFNLYTYNPVYSQMNKAKVFLAEPIDFVNNNIIDTRIYRTSKKINGETSDSWTKFPINNLLDLDTNCGALTKLINFNNSLYFLQNSGIGVIPIAEREVITTNTGSAISIGSGGVMERYDYISTISGISSIQAVTNSTKTLYYIDERKKKICRLSEGIEYLSDLKGIKSFTDSADFSNLITLYDVNFNELWFKLGSSTIIFNEYTNAFTSFTDEYPTKSININNLTFVINSPILGTNYYTLKKLNKELTYKNIELTILANPNNITVNRFDSITLMTEVDRNNSLQNKSISSIELRNNYQVKSESTFYPPARSRFRHYIYNDMRNGGNGTRFTDSYLKIIMKFNKEYSNERIKIYDVVTNYTPINAR